MPESRAKPRAEPAVSFSCLLQEELTEIEALRKKRQWKTNQSSSENQPAINPDQPSREAKPTEKQFVIADSDRTASSTPECEQNADSVFDRAHRRSLVGLAFSGGGIRSATFNLGVLQGLAKLGLLPMFDYISTVSGGGYIGSWLCAWILRTGQDKKTGKCKETAPGNLLAPIQVVQEGLKPDRSTKTQHQEPRPIRFLREYSNYITPRLGVLGADTWTAVAIYVRNLFLNQLILVMFLASILLIPHIARWSRTWLQSRHVFPIS